jgi:murein DD-endopeptidase MepM/ murein hydrolase activator NlpD
LRARHASAAALLLAFTVALQPASAGAAAFSCPITPTWGWLASPYGWRRHPMGGGTGHHWGIDIAAPYGTPVLASMSGTVRYVGWFGNYGLTVYLDHPGGWSTLYGHLSVAHVRPGQSVACTQVVGRVGSTGLSTGPHLHFELRHRGYPVDPIPYLLAARRNTSRR